MEFKRSPYIVYIKLDEANRITAANSSAFLTDKDGWAEIDSGYGDKYHHAQGNYFDKPTMDYRGVQRYQAYRLADAPADRDQIRKFEKDGEPWVIVERTQEEMDADYVARPTPPLSDAERLTALEQQNAELSEQLAAAKILLGLEE